ncbi:hypothetical protein V1522DRAFT_423645 [Lipomyces starkeyi]
MFIHNKQPQLQRTHYAEYDMFQHSAPTGSALGMQQSAGISRKRTIQEAYEEDIEVPLCSGYTLGKIVGMKKRSERPLETHIHASTLRRLFEAAQTQQQLLTGSRGSVSSARDLSCEDCDNVIMLDEYTSDPESYFGVGEEEYGGWVLPSTQPSAPSIQQQKPLLLALSKNDFPNTPAFAMDLNGYFFSQVLTSNDIRRNSKKSSCRK